MAIPQVPWSKTVERWVAPTEQASDVVLVLILAVTLLVLIRGTATHKAALAVWLVAP